MSNQPTLHSSYRGVAKIFRRYWSAYGGWSVVWRSPYLHLAFLLTAVLYHFWLTDAWWDLATSVLPNIIGFALGGYALWLGFGDEEFRRAQSVSIGGKPSPYVAISASFAHFIIVQLVALLIAIVAKGLAFDLDPHGWPSLMMLRMTGSRTFIRDALAPIGHAIGFAFFMYALTTAIAASMAIFRVATWFERDENGNPT
jgi:hypothetical protein